MSRLLRTFSPLLQCPNLASHCKTDVQDPCSYLFEIRRPLNDLHQGHLPGSPGPVHRTQSCGRPHDFRDQAPGGKDFIFGY